MKKYPKFILFLFVVCLVGTGVLYFSDIWQEDENQTQTAQDLKLLTSHSHPEAGEEWAVSFETIGKADLTITPTDQDTIGDLDFTSLKCGGETRSPQVLGNDVIFYSGWQCSGRGELAHLVNIARKHTLEFQFGDKAAFAYNNPDSVTDTFTDTSKIATTSNMTVNTTTGQVYLATCKDNGTACSATGECCSNYCVDGVCCNNVCNTDTCQRCDSYSHSGAGTCDYVSSSSEDPDNECAQGSTTDDGCESNNCSGIGYACGTQASGDGGCPLCGKCADGDFACEYHTANTYDTSPTSCSQCYGCSGSEIGTCTSPQTTACNAGTYGCSGTYNKCYSGSCVSGAAEASCSASGGCCSANPYCYVDADNDRYAPSSGTKTCRVNSQIVGTDCCDSNANAHPNQTSYFTSAMSSPCSGYDYDCDESEEKQASTCSSNRTCTTSGTQYSCYTSSGGGLCLTFLRYAYSGCTDGGYATSLCGQTWNKQYCYASTCLVQDCTDRADTQYYCRTSSDYVCACQ